MAKILGMDIGYWRMDINQIIRNLSGQDSVVQKVHFYIIRMNKEKNESSLYTLFYEMMFISEKT